MIGFRNNVYMIQQVDELPDFRYAQRLYLDVETTSFDDSKAAFSPYTGGRILGVAISADTCPQAYYVPMRHRDKKWNLPLDACLEWLEAQVSTCAGWVNHNIKFDAHFCAEEGAEFKGMLIDTLTLAKLINSDRKEYDLTALARDFLGQDILRYELELHKYLGKSKDFAVIPADIMAPYAGQDVHTTRDLYLWMLERRHEQVEQVWNTEVKVTPVLWDIERQGMRVDPQELKKASFVNSYTLIKIEEIIHKQLGWPLRPHTNDDCFEYLCNQHQLPVLGHTDKGDPSFDKTILAQYLEHPLVIHDEKLVNVIRAMLEYRKTATLLHMFLEPYMEFQVNGYMHPDYNQSVRSGRMSCRRPNAQQLDYEAKTFILAPPGMGLLCYDYNQIEFRLIVHYIRNEVAILAYIEDPLTDFHELTSKGCGVPRRPAKNINFGIGFGAGENRIVSMLSNIGEVIADLMPKVDAAISAGKIHESQRMAIFQALCKQRGKAVYDRYHNMFPELRPTSRAAMQAIRSRGYVYNAYGRHCHLASDKSFKAFNRIIQSCAADVTKDRLVAIAPRYNEKMRDWGLSPFALVHDEFAFYGPMDTIRHPDVQRYIAQTLENTSVVFRVPIRVSGALSPLNWADVSRPENKIFISPVVSGT